MATPATAGTAFLTPQALDEATKAAAILLGAELNFVKKLDDRSSMFKGARTGRTEQIRKTAFGAVRTGQAMSADAIVEEKVNLTIGDPIGSDIELFDDEIELDIGTSEIVNRFIKPRMSSLATKIEQDIQNQMLQATAMALNSATFGLNNLFQMKALQDYKLSSAAGERFALLSPDAMSSLLQDTKALNVPQINGQYKDGIIQDIAGYKVLSSVLQNPFTTTTGRTNTTTSSAQSTEGLTAVAVATTTGIPAVGEVFTIAGCYDVHPVTKVTMSRLKQFVVKTGTTATSLVTDPIYFTGNRKNVSATIGNGVAVTFIGAAASSVEQSMFFLPQCASVAFVDLPMKGGVDSCQKQTVPGTNITLRIIQDYETRSGKNLIRMDVQYGAALVNPELIAKFIKVA